MIVLDTNVLSEVMKPSPAPTVVTWMANENPAGLFTTAVTEGEIRLGLELLPAGRRKQELAAIARSRGMALATRNVADFHGTGLNLIDPWNV